jgi:hypothetical protein
MTHEKRACEAGQKAGEREKEIALDVMQVSLMTTYSSDKMTINQLHR